MFEFKVGDLVNCYTASQEEIRQIVAEAIKQGWTPYAGVENGVMQEYPALLFKSNGKVVRAYEESNSKYFGCRDFSLSEVLSKLNQHKEVVVKINKLTGKPNIGMYENRATGKTTALAFKYISEALANPGKRIKIKDHYPTTQADRHLLSAIRSLIEINGLKHITVRNAECSICFELFEKTNDRYIEVDGEIYKRVK